MGKILGNGQYEVVTSDSASGDTTVNNGGVQLIESNAYAWNATINSGGVQLIWNGGTAIGTKVNAGGYEYVEDGGHANGTVISGYHNDRGTQVVQAGGYANDTVINQFGIQDVDGWVDNTTIFGGGRQVIENGGGAAHTAVHVAGWQFVELGTSWWTTVYERGKQIVDAGGIAMYTTVNGINSAQTGEMMVDAGGIADTATINVYGVQDVYGLAKNTTVNGGVQYIRNGATATGTLVEGGAAEFVGVGGIAMYTTVNGSNSEMMVEAGGIADTATINVYGVQDVIGGLAKNTTVNGGFQGIWNGGTATGTLVKGGGVEFVGVGGDAVNTTLNANGVERVQAGGKADGVTFGSTNALLDLANADCVHGPITGFQHGDNIDLRNLQFGAGTTLAFSQNAQHTGGTLTISDGSSVGQLTLVGQYSAGQFQLASDGHGGTLVSDTGQFRFNPAVFAAGAQLLNPAVYAAAPH